MRRILLLLPLLLVSCVDFPNQYAPPRARRPDNGPDPRGLKPFVEMKDAASLAHFAWGINPAAFDGEKRKAEARAALRFRVVETANQKLSIDFFAATAQQVRFRVNARPVGEVSAAGATHFESPVEATDFLAGTATLLEIESEAGISLLRAGFLRR